MESQLEKVLERLLPDTPYTHAANYALLGGAKRLRPKLVLLTVEMVGGEVEHALIPAAALEMIHTYSLIHDDLPCMDDDDFRRGRPTVHKAFGEATAVLAGDLLLTHAFEQLAKAPHLSPLQKIELISALASASGVEGMIGGQMRDLEKTQDIETLHEMKTAALFACAMHFGAIIGNVDPRPLIEFGKTFGLLFQTRDDLIDKDHPLGRERGEKRAKELKEKCFSQLEKLPYPTDKIFHFI